MPLTSATTLSQVRVLLNEPTPRFFADSDLTTWIAEAARDISSKSGCVECVATVALSPSTILYPEPAAFTNPVPVSASATLLKLSAAFFNNVALHRAHPRMFGHANDDTTGNVPSFYAQFGDNVLFYPVGPGAAGTVTLLGAIVVEMVEDLPMEWQSLVFPYVLYRAKQKDLKWAEAASCYAEYINSVAFQTNMLLDRGVSSRADVQIPDQIIVDR